VVTATGAALRAERSEDAPRSDQERGEDEPVSARQVEVDWRTRRLLAAADEGSVRLSGGAMGISHSEPGDRTGPVYPRLFIRDSVNNMLNQPVLSKKKTRVVCWAQDDVGALPEPSAKHISTTCPYNNLLGAG
jgi:hypothetical protein